MFSTFTTVTPQALAGSQQEPTPTFAPQNGQPKRSQGGRACDWCRLHRIKCDSNYPCRNCQIKNRQCNKGGACEVRTLPHAIREIERLNSRVKELEAQLEQNNNSTLLPSPQCSTAASSTPTPTLDPLKDHGCYRKYWQGIHTSTTQSNKTQCYGPSSSFYFMGRMSAFLGAVFQQPHPDFHMQPNGPSRSFASPTSARRGDAGENLMSADISNEEASITSTQEDYFLSLFWQSYHSTLQILDETEFREHYKSLWAPSHTSRKPSALVDIVLALCMQYGVALLPRKKVSTGGESADQDNDATIAGRWFYRRAQSLLSFQLESPSIMTLQCHIFSVLYLCNASFQNMAHSTLALAIRTAQIIGLHLEPSEDMPRNQRELRKRLWWTVYALEIKTCMKLGRPLSAQISQVTCSLPDDDHALALQSGTNCVLYGEKVTWFTYTLENIKLILAAQAVYTAFYDKCAQALNVNNGQSLYHDPQSLEQCAGFLQSSMGTLQAWLEELPDALKTKRKGGGEPFSLDRSTLEVEVFVPVWLQRQRLLLELLYHNLSNNLYRPFICFGPTLGASTPLTERNAVLCVSHAITITQIMHQVITQTDILNAWNEAYMWQWNASLSIVGFLLAYPLNPAAPTAYQAIDDVIVVLEKFSNNHAIPVAASAANVIRGLRAKADLLMDRFRGGTSTPLHAPGESGDPLHGFRSPGTTIATAAESELISHADDDTAAMIQNDFMGSMGLELTVDSITSFEPFWWAGGMSDVRNWNCS